MDRRTFIPVAPFIVFGTPLGVGAQQAGKLPRLGVLRAGAPDLIIEQFRQGLRDLGWVEGQNLVIEYRFAGGRLDQLPDLAADVVRLRVDIIFAPTFPAALAARNATPTIPIVCTGHADFVQAELVTSLARPGGNVTGVTTSGTELSAKRLESLERSDSLDLSCSGASAPSESSGGVCVEDSRASGAVARDTAPAIGCPNRG